MSGRLGGTACAAFAMVVGLGSLSPRLVAQQGTARAAAPSSSLRLYVFDCGTLEGADVKRFGLEEKEVVTGKMSVACYLIVHPKGTLAWDVGAVPDGAWTPGPESVVHRVTLADGQQRAVRLRKRLDAQLREVGHAPDTIGHLALSHNHWDHTANANHFSKATWLVRKEEHEVMFPVGPSKNMLMLPATFDALRARKRITITAEEHDVFGDGTVVAKLTPGHTPGHLVLYVKLAKTGGVLLSGDLYHYPEERTLNRLPIFEVDQNQTRAARTAVEAYLTKMGATLWIQHDFTADAKLRKAPAYYE